MTWRNKIRREQLTENAGNRYAKKKGVMHRKMNGFGFNAWPDQLYTGTKGRDLYVEYKRVGEGPTPLQADIHKELRRRGKKVMVVDDNNLEACYAAIDALVS